MTKKYRAPAVLHYMEMARKFFFPTKSERMVTKWWAAGGDPALRFNYPDLNEHSLIYDVGGWRGDWTSDMYSRYNCNAVVFEPISAFAETIRRRFKQNKKVSVRNYGLGATERIDAISS